MKKNQIILVWLLALQIVLQLQASSELAVASWDQGAWENWVTATAPNDASLTLELKQMIQQANKHVGMVVAEAIGILQRGTKAGAPANQIPLYYAATQGGGILTTAWLGQFATLLSSGVPPYQNMKRFELSSVFSTASVEYGYIMNHLVPALNQLNATASSTVDATHFTTAINFTPGSFNGAIITTINNNTQMSFDIYQGSNQIGLLAPGVNSVALYGAAQSQGDIVFVPTEGNCGSFRVSFKTGPEVVAIANASAVANGTTPPYSAQYPPAQAGAESEFMCVQITPADFPAGTSQQTIQMIQRTQCINLSQLTCPVNITLNIEDNMTVMNQGAPTEIGQTMVPMFYPSISNIVLINKQIFPFLILPENLASQPVLSSWVSFINMVVGTVLTTYQTLFTPDYISWFVGGQPKVFLLKQSGNDFGDISQPVQSSYLLSPAKTSGGQIISTVPFVAKQGFAGIIFNSIDQAIAAKGRIVNLQPLQPVHVQYAFAGLPGTQYLFTGDIPNFDEFGLYLQYNSALNQPQHIVSLDSSITVTNILPLLQKNSMSIWANLVKELRLKVKLVSISGDQVLYAVDKIHAAAGSTAQALLSNTLLMPFLSTLTTIVSLRDVNGAPCSFVMKDVIASIQSLSSNTTSKTYMPLVGGLWSYLQQQYDLSVSQPNAGSFHLYSPRMRGFVKFLQQNPTAIATLLQQKQLQLRDSSNNTNLMFNSLDTLNAAFNQRRMTIDSKGKIVQLSKSELDKLQQKRFSLKPIVLAAT